MLLGARGGVAFAPCSLPLVHARAGQRVTARGPRSPARAADADAGAVSLADSGQEGQHRQRTPEERRAHRRRHKQRRAAARRAAQADALRAARAACPLRWSEDAALGNELPVDALWASVESRWTAPESTHQPGPHQPEGEDGNEQEGGQSDVERSLLALGALEWGALPAAADLSRGGGLRDSRKGSRARRKSAQVESVRAALRLMGCLEPGCVVVDFGCGSGNLCLALGAAHPLVTFVGVDGNARAATLLAERAADAQLSNVVSVAGRIERFFDSAAGRDLARVDACVALHVCGAGTDHSLLEAIKRQAAFVALPCCVGKVTAASPNKLVDVESGRAAAGAGGRGLRDVSLNYPRSSWLATAIDAEAYASLCAAADFAGHDGLSGYDSESEEGVVPRAAVRALGADRLHPASEAGYDVWLAPMPAANADVRGTLLLGVPQREEAAASRLHEWLN